MPKRASTDARFLEALSNKCRKVAWQLFVIAPNLQPSLAWRFIFEQVDIWYLRLVRILFMFFFNFTHAFNLNTSTYYFCASPDPSATEWRASSTTGLHESGHGGAICHTAQPLELYRSVGRPACCCTASMAGALGGRKKLSYEMMAVQKDLYYLLPSKTRSAMMAVQKDIYYLLPSKTRSARAVPGLVWFKNRASVSRSGVVAGPDATLKSLGVGEGGN